MSTSKFIKPQEQLDGTCVLDMRSVPLQGRELYDLINGSVERSQMFVITKLPDVLKITQQQFASLNSFTAEMYHTTDRMFVSADSNNKVQCVMEVWIDREYGTREDIEQNMQAVDAEVEMRNREKGITEQEKPNSNNFPFDGIIPMS